jgi:hypothetical protein
VRASLEKETRGHQRVSAIVPAAGGDDHSFPVQATE